MSIVQRMTVAIMDNATQPITHLLSNQLLLLDYLNSTSGNIPPTILYILITFFVRLSNRSSAIIYNIFSIFSIINSKKGINILEVSDFLF